MVESMSKKRFTGNTSLHDMIVQALKPHVYDECRNIRSEGHTSIVTIILLPSAVAKESVLLRQMVDSSPSLSLSLYVYINTNVITIY